jgi:hypothetical protein
MIFPVHLRISLLCSWNDLNCLRPFQSWPYEVFQSWLDQDSLSFSRGTYVDCPNSTHCHEPPPIVVLLRSSTELSREGIFQSWLLEDTSEFVPFKVLKHPTSGDISDCQPRWYSLSICEFPFFAAEMIWTVCEPFKVDLTRSLKVDLIRTLYKLLEVCWLSSPPHSSPAKKSRRAVERRNLSKLTFGRHFRICTIQSPQTSNFRRHLRLSA